MTKTVGFKNFESLKLKLSEYENKTIEKGKSFFDEVSKFHECEAIIIYNNQSIEFIQILLKHEYLKLRIYYWEYRKQYAITCESLSDLKNISDSCILSAKKLEIEPKKIGKLTNNKICEWIKYWENIYFTLVEKDRVNKDMKEFFLNSLNGFQIRWEDKVTKKHGHIKMNGLIFSFNIEHTYISKRITLSNYLINDLTTFIKLSNNQLNSF